LKSAENAVVSLALFVMVLIPLTESFLRRTFHVGISSSTSIVQHMVLVVGMLGGAIAARDGRLLSLSTLGETSLRGRAKTVARIFASGVSATVSAFLSLAAYQFVATEREVGKILAYGVPLWVVECVLPIGFAVIAIRILRHTSERGSLRIAAALAAAFFVGVLLQWPGGFHHSVLIS
jgi:TRAP-type C4-dicarboxylate transport system permease small subunit